MFEVLFLAGMLACTPTTGLGLRMFSIPSGSMEPGLPVGSVATAYRCAYGFSRYSYDGFDLPIKGRIPDRLPARGDVVIFRLPTDRSTFYIKRVIGLPGEEVRLVAGRVYINDKALDRHPLPPMRVKFGDADVEAAAFQEVLPGGRTYTIIEKDGDSGPLETTQAFQVPPDQIFVLGDNRDNSIDSRIAPGKGGYGFVPTDLIFGQVVGVGPRPSWSLDFR